MNMNAIIPRECFEQMDSLVDNTVPGVSFFVLERGISESAPFLEECCGTIFLAEKGAQGILEAATENHRCPGLFFPPAIQVTVAIAAGAAQILTDLCVAIDHRCLPADRSRRVKCIRVPPSLPRERRH